MLSDFIVLILTTVSPEITFQVVDIVTGLSTTECAAKAADFAIKVNAIHDVGQLVAVCETYFTAPPVNS